MAGGFGPLGADVARKGVAQHHKLATIVDHIVANPVKTLVMIVHKTSVISIRGGDIPHQTCSYPCVKECSTIFSCILFCNIASTEVDNDLVLFLLFPR